MMLSRNTATLIAVLFSGIVGTAGIAATALFLLTDGFNPRPLKSQAVIGLTEDTRDAANNFNFSVNTLGSLKALTMRPRVVRMHDYAEANDGGGGDFVWVLGDSTPPDDCVTVKPAAGEAGRFKRIVEGAINIRACGARSTAVDNAAAIQIALNAGLTLNKAVYVPAGTYAVGATLVAGKGAVLVGEGWQSIIKAKNGSNLPAVLSIGSEAAVSAASIRDLQFDCNKANNPSGGDGVGIVRGYRANLYNVRVTFCREHGVAYRAAGSSFENYIYNVSLYGNDGYGLYMLGNVTDTHVIGGDIGFNATGGVHLSTSSSINGATIWGGGQANSTGVVVAGVSSQIVGNRIEGHGRHGIHVGVNDYIYIANNKIYANAFTAGTSGSYDGIFIEAGADFGTITGNKIYSSVVASSPYSMRYAVNFAGAHEQWTIAANDMALLVAGSPAAFKMSGAVVNGLLPTDKGDFNWIRSRVHSRLSANLKPASSNAWIVLPFNTNDADPLSEFANGVFTPKNSGLYRIEVMVLVTPTGANECLGLALYTNAGAEVRRIDFRRAESTSAIAVRGVIDEFLAAGTAYEIRQFMGSTAITLNAGGEFTYLRIRAVPN